MKNVPWMTFEFGCFDAGHGSNDFVSCDIGEDLGVRQRSLGDEVMPQKEIANDEYLQQERS
jgi:hypothetical protein